VDKGRVALFFPLLQQGVGVVTTTGCSIASFLRSELEVSDALIKKIQSIVLDGCPVDDIETAVLRNSSVLALSAAMPGLVGATLRRDGRYSSFRSAITYHESAKEVLPERGLVVVKVFNLLMADLGPGLLKKGVVIRTKALLELCEGQPEELWKQCRKIMINESPVDQDVLPDPNVLAGPEVMLFVSAE